MPMFGSGSGSGWSAEDAQRLARVEAKLDRLLAGLHLEPPPAPAPAADPLDPVRALARDPARTIEAIKLYREITGAGLKEAKDAVDQMTRRP